MHHSCLQIREEEGIRVFQMLALSLRGFDIVVVELSVIRGFLFRHGNMHYGQLWHWLCFRWVNKLVIIV